MTDWLLPYYLALSDDVSELLPLLKTSPSSKQDSQTGTAMLLFTRLQDKLLFSCIDVASVAAAYTYNDKKS